MKKLFGVLLVLALVLSFSVIASAPVGANGGPETVVFPAGSLTTTSLGEWDRDRLFQDVCFDLTAGPMTILVTGLDFTDMGYEGKWPWPPDPEGMGAIGGFGITQNNNWSRHSIQSSIGDGYGSWDAQGTPWDHDDGFRKYLIMNYYDGSDSAGVGNHQYNVEAYIPRTGAGPGSNDPAQVTDRGYNTFDMKVTYTPTATPGVYEVQGWVRLHKSAATTEMADRPGDPEWGSPHSWRWNWAINNVADPEDAWRTFYDGTWTVPGAYTAARPYFTVINWGTPQHQYHTLSWDSMVIEGHLTPSKVWTTADTGDVSFDTDTGCILELAALPELPAPAPRGVSFPHGMFSFEITCINPGDTVQVTIELPQDVPEGTVWWKHHDGTWYSLPNLEDNGDNIMVIELTDGGLGDTPGSPPGTILDPGGPGNPVPPLAVGWEGSAVNRAAVMAPWIALFALIAGASLLVVRRRRAQI